MSFVSDTEVDQAAKAFSEYLKLRKIDEKEGKFEEDRIIAFTDGFLKGWKRARTAKKDLHIVQVISYLTQLFQELDKNQETIEDIRLFGNCVGSLQGMFQFKPMQVLSRSNLYLYALGMLREQRKFNALSDLIHFYVKEWVNEMRKNRSKMSGQILARFDDFVRQF